MILETKLNTSCSNPEVSIKTNDQYTNNTCPVFVSLSQISLQVAVKSEKTFRLLLDFKNKQSSQLSARNYLLDAPLTNARIAQPFVKIKNSETHSQTYIINEVMSFGNVGILRLRLLHQVSNKSPRCLHVDVLIDSKEIADNFAAHFDKSCSIQSKMVRNVCLSYTYLHALIMLGRHCWKSITLMLNLLKQ